MMTAIPPSFDRAGCFAGRGGTGKAYLRPFDDKVSVAMVLGDLGGA